MSGPAERMASARGHVADALGIEVEDLPLDACIESAIDADGVLHIRGDVALPGFVDGIDVLVHLRPCGTE